MSCLLPESDLALFDPGTPRVRCPARLTALASGRCAVEQVAEQLGVDRRTLHHRVATGQLTFSPIVEAGCPEIVSRTLQRREHALGAIAYMVGFASLSAFSRWFPGRFGVSPSTWRLQSDGRQ